MRALFACLPFALAACASAANMDADVDRLAGRPVKPVLDRMGPPTGQTEIAGGGRSYFWVENGDMSVTDPEAPSKFGTVSPTAMVAPPPTAGTTTYHLHCWVRINAGPDGRITDAEWSKNGEGCEGLAARLGGF